MKPTLLKDFVGQTKIRDTLDVCLRAARSREEMIDHILLYGPPGLGKTTLANIIANEMATEFQAIPAPAISKSADLASALTNLKERHVFFIDEIHRLNTNIEEMLYSAMDDYKLSIMIGEGVSARTMTIQLPHFTLIGATTRLSMLGIPFRERFGIHLRLDFYDEAALCQIIRNASISLGIELMPDADLSIARRSRGTPRVALRLLRRVRDFADVSSSDKVDKQMCDDTLSYLGIDSMGLDHDDRKYLEFIMKHYGEGHVGIDTIAMGLNERRDTIEETIEPYLIQMGLIKKTSRGRSITKKAAVLFG